MTIEVQMGKEILNKHIPKLKVQEGSSYPSGDKIITYGLIKFNDLVLGKYIGKDVELEVIVREYDKNIINKE